MVTKCNPETTTTSVRELCENPDLDGSLESVTPVTDTNTNTHYRNQFCSVCNGVDETAPLAFWTLNIVCDRVVFASDKNILHVIKDRRCNIFFENPEQLYIRLCEMPSYRISTCNETGLWPTYDRATELACNSFLDPFNATYKNYFCYVCNTETPLESDNGTCGVSDFDEINDVTPPFSIIFKLDTIRPVTNDEPLDCDATTQFEDHKMVIIDL